MNTPTLSSSRQLEGDRGRIVAGMRMIDVPELPLPAVVLPGPGLLPDLVLASTPRPPGDPFFARPVAAEGAEQGVTPLPLPSSPHRAPQNQTQKKNSEKNPEPDFQNRGPAGEKSQKNSEATQGELAIERCAVTNPPWWLEPDVIYSVGISGGKDSGAALLWMIHESGIPRHQIIASFCDTGNEHDWTYAHVKLLSETVHPITTLHPDLKFFELADHKRRFPSTKMRFCTQFLKIFPSQDHVQRLKAAGHRVISVSGVRADESEERRNQPEWDYSGTLLCHQWRPLIRWTIADVMAIHEKHGVPLNPLYSIGALRVGCWPCIMSRKSEIRTIALKFPERIDQIRAAENAFEEKYGRYSSFFARNAVPERFRTKTFIQDGKPVMEDVLEVIGYDEDGRKITRKIGEKPMMVATIDDVVRWSLTGDRAQGRWDDEPAAAEPISCNSGFCE